MKYLSGNIVITIFKQLSANLFYTLTQKTLAEHFIVFYENTLDFCLICIYYYGGHYRRYIGHHALPFFGKYTEVLQIQQHLCFTIIKK